MRHLAIELTYRCNGRCPHCYIDRTQPIEQELGSDEVRALLARHRECGGQSVTFTGGEIALRRDLADLIAAARGLELDVLLTTNGTHPSLHRAAWLEPQTIRLVRVSLDGPSEVHDQRRGARAFARAKAFLQRLDAATIPFEIQCTFTPDTLSAVPWLWDFADQFRYLRTLKFTPQLALAAPSAAATFTAEQRVFARALIGHLQAQPAPQRFTCHTELSDATELDSWYAQFRRDPQEQLLFVVRPDGQLLPWYGIDGRWSLGPWRQALQRELDAVRLEDIYAVFDEAHRRAQELLQLRSPPRQQGSLLMRRVADGSFSADAVAGQQAVDLSALIVDAFRARRARPPHVVRRRENGVWYTYDSCQPQPTLDQFVEEVSFPVRLAGSAPLTRPVLAEWEVTHACNLNCFYCYFGSNRQTTAGPLNTAQALAVARDLADAGVLSVTLEGGEPLLRSDLADICAELSRHSVQVRILTNGLLLSPERARELAAVLDRRTDLVQVSLDGSTPETHGLSRGPGSFAATVAGIENAAAAGLRVQVSMVVHEGNLDDILATYRRVSRVPGVVSFFASHYMRAGSGLALQPVDKHKLLQAYSRVERAAAGEPGPPLSLLPGHLLHLDSFFHRCQEEYHGPEFHYCRAGRAKVAVAEDGSVYPCHFLMYPEFLLGDLTREKLADLWNGAQARRLHEPRRPDGECFTCDRGRWCGRKCMGLAYAAYGSLDRADPNCEYARPHPACLDSEVD